MPHAAPRGAVHYDENDKPYMMMQGQRYYLSPMAMGESSPEDTQGATFMHTRPRWNQHTGEWERPINWGNVLSLAAGGGIAGGGLSAAGVFGGGSAATTAPLTLAEIEGGAAGLTPEALAGLGPAVGAEAGVGLGPTAAAFGPEAEFAGEAPAFDAAGNFIGPSTVTGATEGASTFSKIAPWLKRGSEVLNRANQAAVENRDADTAESFQAQRTNIAGQSAFETELLNRARREEEQRAQALKDIYRQSYTQNRRPGPFNAAGLPAVSPGYTEALSGLEQQALKRLRTAPQYGTDVMPALPPYVPMSIKANERRKQTGTEESTLGKIGKWVGTGMTVADLFGL